MKSVYRLSNSVRVPLCRQSLNCGGALAKADFWLTQKPEHTELKQHLDLDG